VASAFTVKFVVTLVAIVVDALFLVKVHVQLFSLPKSWISICKILSFISQHTLKAKKKRTISYEPIALILET